MTTRVRFAPSPTGYLHVGGARTALFNWLFARNKGGEFILRIEDTDQSRSTEESIEEIEDSMSWLGLDWDEYYRQTNRTPLYQESADELIEEGRVYESEGALWFRVPGGDEVVVEDLVLGSVSFSTDELKDFVIRRSDGSFTYNFACVVDDAELGITHVMRGDDHLNNTPKQLLIYSALEIDPPEFAHFPMILGKDGKRLSKRHGATSVLSYKERGFLPEGLVNFLARLGWSHGDQEVFSVGELVDYFSLDSVGGSSAVFDEDKLLWINHQWLQRKEPDELGNLFKRYLVERDYYGREELEGLPPEKFAEAAELLRERNKTLSDLAEASAFVIKEELSYSDTPLEEYTEEKPQGLLGGLAERLSSLPEDEFRPEELERVTRSYLDENDGGLGDIAQLCRVALTGRTVSPGLFETMELVGKRKTVNRLLRASEF
ncbi:MAG: glutamate--tRNA ligase [Candidatus Acetothermia bacterium]